jgi:hypothetical protein
MRPENPTNALKKKKKGKERKGKRKISDRTSGLRG